MPIHTTDPIPPALSSEQAVEAFVRKLALAVAHQLSKTPLNSPFIRTSECAQLLDVTPEHLCAMRARGEGPAWSGEGKWVRYERIVVIEWLRNLPRQTKPNPLRDAKAGPDTNHRFDSG